MFLKYRYLILSSMIFALMCVSASKQYWTGDFWVHSAVINELAFNPLHPEHPQLALDAPHPFYSPYALVWSLVSRVTHWSSIETLSRAAVVNIFLFLIGLYLFISSIVLKDRGGVAFYSLLFILLLWGPMVWNYSGFFHLRVLGYVLPYPSTFCAALSFVTLALNKWRIDKNQGFWLVPILLSSVVILLSHPFTYIFLASGLVAMMFSKKGALLPELLRIAGLLLATVLLAGLWPYYPFLKFILSESSVYYESNLVMYQDVFLKIWPALVGVPLLLLDFRSNWRQPLPLMFGILLLVYAFGGIFQAYGYGRVISYTVIILDITIAIHLVELENKFRLRGSGVLCKPFFICSGVVLILIAFSFTTFIKPALDRSIFSIQKSYEKYYFLLKYVDHYDPVLAYPSTSWMLPSFSGKLVGTGYDTPFVPDAQTRLNDASRFFDLKTTQEDRAQVIQKYGVKYILLEKSPTSNWETLRIYMRDLGKLVFQSKRFFLYSIDSN